MKKEEKRSFIDFMFNKTEKQEVKKVSRENYSPRRTHKVAIFNDVEQILRNDAVRACIKTYTNIVKKSKFTLQNIHDENLRYVLDNPNSVQSREEFLEAVTVQLLINNNCFIYPRFDSNYKLRELNVIDFRRCELIIDKESKEKELADRLFVKFTLKEEFEQITLAYSDLIHIKQNISNERVLSETTFNDLRSVVEIVKNNDLLNLSLASRASDRSFKVSSSTPLHEDDIAENLSIIFDNIKSQDGVTLYPEVQGLTLQELDEAETSKELSTKNNEAIQRIYNYFNVNEKIVSGIWEEDAYHKFIQNSIDPLLSLISSNLSKFFLTKKQKEKRASIILYLVNNKLENLDTKELVETVKDLVDIGVLKKNEIRRFLGLPELTAEQGGEELTQSLNYMNSENITEYKLNKKEKEKKGEEKNEE